MRVSESKHETSHKVARRFYPLRPWKRKPPPVPLCFDGEDRRDFVGKDMSPDKALHKAVALALAFLGKEITGIAPFYLVRQALLMQAEGEANAAGYLVATSWLEVEGESVFTIRMQKRGRGWYRARRKKSEVRRIGQTAPPGVSIRTYTMENPAGKATIGVRKEAAKDQIVRELEHWITFAESEGKAEDSHIYTPPVWPTLGTLKQWVLTLKGGA